ncbi:sigma factor [Streptomyces sp. NPDC051219]|uniref:RNA polymerase sigma factor n=1 Tax=Streptomyces sp. NPDC051219 TaxID=3155283 RepID=UPI00341712E6
MDEWSRFETVYRDTCVPVLRFLRRRLPHEAAEDALSEVYLTAWRRRAEVRGEPLPWLYGIARLVVANTVRSTGRRYRLRELMLAAGDDRPAPAAEQSAVDRLGTQSVPDTDGSTSSASAITTPSAGVRDSDPGIPIHVPTSDPTTTVAARAPSILLRVSCIFRPLSKPR